MIHQWCLINTGKRGTPQIWKGHSKRERVKVRDYLWAVAGVLVVPCHVVPCCATLLQLCLTLCDPMDCSPPGLSVHGILPMDKPTGLSVHGILPTRIRAWKKKTKKKKNTGVGCHVLLHGIFPTQGSNPPLLQLPHCRQGKLGCPLDISIFYEEEGKKVKVSSDVPLLQAACEAPMPMKTSNWVVCSVDMPTRRGHSVSLGGHFICCEF